jgi:hypothetical protein
MFRHSYRGKLARSPRARFVMPAIIAIAASAGSATAVPSFSIDYESITKGTPDAFTGTPITEGDILIPGLGGPGFGPLPVPGIVVSGGFGPPPPGLGLPAHPAAIGLPPGIPGRVEVDALSYGMDYLVTPDAPGQWNFSVDEWATGIPGSPLPPNVFSEGAFGPSFEAAADVFRDLGLPPGPLPPGAGPTGNTGVLDGDGLMSPSGFVYPGVGLVEPHFPAPGPQINGDNLDALDMDTPVFPGDTPPVFFSLDADTFDPLEGMPNTFSAMANGPFVGGDVLVTLPGTLPMVYAPAPSLGLDLVGGPDSDDLDALVLWDDGDLVFTPSFDAYDWAFGLSDMLLFSVRRGSAVIGMPDSFFGIPIEEGDILMPPVPGGVSPFPGIFIAAENLGLATARSGFAPIGDDLDALDVLVPTPGTLAILMCGGLTLLRRRS